MATGVETAPVRPICPISGSDDAEPFCRQTAGDGRSWEWVRFPETGFVRLAQMPDAETLIQKTVPHGAGYIRDLEAKWDSKRRRSRRRARYLKKAMTTGTRVLDVGSNVGLFSKACAEAGLDPVGLEFSDSLVGYARERFPEISFHPSTLEAFETDETFDGIYCSEVIEHSTDPEAFGRKLFSLLTPGGVLYLTTPDLNEYLDGTGTPNRNLGAPDHKLYFQRSNIAAFLKRCGFSDVRHRFSFKKGIQVLARR
jgi:2-polyprenyl-3-methyl-5-hydroxy-6-metoxy-1,4-benzoquinol methylase